MSGTNSLVVIAVAVDHLCLVQPHEPPVPAEPWAELPKVLTLAGCKNVAIKITDPVRAEAYAHLGIATLCRTTLMSAAVLSFTGQAAPERPGIYPPQQAHEHPIDGAGPGVVPARPATGGPSTPEV